MLDELHISDVALIRDASFAPGEGLTVITGETGAGKTALLSSLKLLAGERADTSTIREGQSELSVEGRFFLPDSPEEGDVVERRVSAAGRSRISLNGAPSSVKAVAARVGASIDLCGQHEHQRLLKPDAQLALLDAWAGDTVAGALGEYRQALAEARAAAAELDRLRELARASEVELDRARYVVDQIEAVDPKPGEYEELLSEMPRYQHAEAILRDLSLVRESLVGEGGALEALETALAAAERIADTDLSRKDDAGHLRDAFFTAEDAWSELSSYEQTIEFDPAEVLSRQDRIAAFQGLMRGFGPRMEDVWAAYEAARATICEYDNRDDLIDAAERSLGAAEDGLADCAGVLADARSEALPVFEGLVNTQMARLHMGDARIVGEWTDLPREQWGSQGSAAFQLLFAPASEVTPRPLAKIASGGELSRVMLACKVVIGDRDEAQTLVFDEIDTGVGGATAAALADVLADLAQSHQVIVVTHLAQVAVRGGVHYVVRKQGQGLPETCLDRLDGEARVREIARMLSGETSAESLAHARVLLGLGS